MTFRQLLNHTSGLPAWKPYYESVTSCYESVIPAKAGIQGRRGATAVLPEEMAGARAGARAVTGKSGCLERIHDEELVARPGEQVLYSDLGFILLGEAVERLSGRAAGPVLSRRDLHPDGVVFDVLRGTWGGQSREPRPCAGRTIAATEDCGRRRKILCGEVHDGNAFAMGGVAGHAGVFSSAPDVHRFLRFLGRCCYEDAEPDFLPGAVVSEFLDAERPLPGQTHVLGWDTPSPEGSSSGRHFSAPHRRPPGLHRHLHLVGPSSGTFTSCFLTNRVHPSPDNAAIREYRPLVHDAIMEGLRP